MNNSLDKALYYLTGNGNIDAVPLEELEKLANNHPYFPVAHFLLSKKLKKLNSPNFLSEVQKTALYFPNPYWLHYQLLNDLPDEPIIHDNDEVAANESFDDDLLNIDTAHNIEEPTAVVEEEEIKANDQQIETTQVASETASTFDVSEQHQASLHEAENIAQREEEMAAITRNTDATATQLLTEPDNAQHEQEFAEEQSQQLSSSSTDKPEDDEHEKMFQNIKAMLDASAEEANADVKSGSVPIDPYYTIDYFAAQGIKLDLENPQDKLGKQVKKFTQWLKHMKKLGPEDSLTADSPSPAELQAQQTADASNIAREVVTEAMALVLEKQGKNDKAIQLYRKLTFLNPHKSAYFADKINHLNGLKK